MTRPDPFDACLDALRADADSAPDQTRSIMGRLGYMRVSEQRAQRQRWWRRIRRGGMMLGGLGLIAAGLHVAGLGPDVRRPGEAALGRALEVQFETRGAELGRVFEALGTWTPPAEPEDSAPGIEDPAPLDEDVDRSAIAAVRWV